MTEAASEIERLTQALDRCDDARMKAEKLAARQAEEIAEAERAERVLSSVYGARHEEHIDWGAAREFLARKRGA